MSAGMDLNGKAALISGAGGGICRAIAVAFAEAGASVACADINAEAAAETARLLDDPSIDFVVIAARPCYRAELAIAAMHRGKDVMVDKPGVTTLEQLAAVERARRRRGVSGRSA